MDPTTSKNALQHRSESWKKFQNRPIRLLQRPGSLKRCAEKNEQARPSREMGDANGVS